MDKAMQLAIEMLSNAFKEFQIQVDKRPGGGLLVSLCQAEQPVLQRVLPVEQCQSALHLEWLISAIRRDLAIEAGRAPQIANLQSQSRMRLPTYN